MTDQEIIAALASVLGAYSAEHPKVARTKIRFYDSDGGLLTDLHFSTAPSGPSFDEEQFVKQLGARILACGNEPPTVMIDQTDMSREEKNFVAHFGGCPHCGEMDGIVNVGRGHWLRCDRHEIKWYVGSNLFDSWRHQTEAEQRKEYDEIGLGEYREITCEKAHSHPLVRQWERDLDEAVQKSGDVGAAEDAPF
jgi:hypothetical protein